MPEWSPELSIVHGGGILSPNGRMEVDVRTVDVQQLRWEVQRLYPNNVVPFLNGSWYGKWDTTSRTVTKGILQCEGPRNKVLDHVLPLREHLENPIGIHRIELADNDRNSWLLYKAERDHHAVLIHSIASAQPLPQVRVELRSDKNQVPEGFTDQNGWVRSACRMVGPNPVAGEGLMSRNECFLYPERSMYRPGESRKVVFLKVCHWNWCDTCSPEHHPRFRFRTSKASSKLTLPLMHWIPPDKSDTDKANVTKAKSLMSRYPDPFHRQCPMHVTGVVRDREGGVLRSDKNRYGGRRLHRSDGFKIDGTNADEGGPPLKRLPAFPRWWPKARWMWRSKCQRSLAELPQIFRSGPEDSSTPRVTPPLGSQTTASTWSKTSVTVQTVSDDQGTASRI